jgi:serine/threonine protein kinase/tetratricopeptide (TPR) repeat protein
MSAAEAVFFAALAKVDPAERAAYLNEACGTNADLRRQVDRLLAAHPQVGSFLLDDGAAHPSPRGGVGREVRGGATVDTPVTERPGTIIGPYKLLQQIGEGGMGTVFMAEQSQPVQRKVALKVIKPGMDSRQVIARFEAERQALAIMDHVNIARVFDGGATESGRPYFVMELVHGVPITKYCDDHHLTPRERLELFVPVCHAIQHAHQKGIIHRDIKPSNVMVTLYDGKPVPKVIDFGVAKATEQKLTERTLFTQYGTMVGTLEYMSPEQAEMSALGVDTRSDIYSLGVLLYELLTGSTPLTRKQMKEAAYVEILRMIKEEEPPRPSTRLSDSGEALASISAQRKTEPAKLTKLVRGELDWIVMKTLEKDRNRRYETANGFAMDLQRYLHDEPVQACPPSTVYRLRKFVRRNKVALTTAALLALALVTGTIVSAWQAIRATEAEGLAQTRLEAETEARNATREQLRLTTAAEQQARQERDRTAQAERLARRREAEALVGQAHGIRLSRRPGQRFDALAALGKAAAIGRDLGQPPAWFDPLRNEGIAALALPDLHITQEFGSCPPGTGWVELNDDLTLYVRTTDKGGCTIRRVDDDTEVARLPELGEPAHANFGAGRILAVHTSGNRFQLWDLGGARPVLRFEERAISHRSFRNDGRLFALGHQDGSISVYEAASGKRLHRLAPVPNEANYPSLHPTAPFVACHAWGHHDVLIRDLHSGAVVATAVPPWGPPSSYAAWSPDGRTLMVADVEKSGIIQEYAFDAAAPALRLRRNIQGPDVGGAHLSYNPAGDRFVRRGWLNVVHLFDAASGQELFRTHLQLPATLELRFDQTGQRLAGARAGHRNDRIGLWSVADGREYRALVHASSEPAFKGEPAIHPGGRLAAMGLERGAGVALFDLSTGRELAHLAIGQQRTLVTFDGTGSLLTNGFEGFFRWPVRPDSASPGRLLVGPAERLPFHPGHCTVAVSHDGRVIAQCMWGGYGMEANAGGWILHPNSPAPRRVEAGRSLGRTSVSPDGRWVAFGGPEWMAVYDSATGRRVCQPPVDGWGECCFSRDGAWLVTNQDGGRLYATGTWKPGPQLGPGIPWDTSPDCTLAVLAHTNGIYHLVELATGRELARLEDPEQNTGAAAFTPDGTQLVVTGKNGLRVWDLRRIRAELAKMGLDWDAPPYPPAIERKDPPPLQVTVDLGQVGKATAAIHASRGLTHFNLGEWDKALAEYSKAIELDRKNAGLWNNRGNAYHALRQYDKAIADYSKAIDLDSKLALAWSNRGATYYHLDQYNKALSDLNEAIKLDPKNALAWNRRTCAACLAAAGKGKDAGKLDGTKRAELRHKALAWLRDDVQAGTQSLRHNPASAALLPEKLKHWQSDPDLSSVRDATELAKLPQAEQQAWHKLWSEVDQLLKQASAAFTEINSLKGRLTATDTEQVHEVQMSAGKTYVIDMTSNDFDTCLRLETANKKILAENDDIAPDNLNSRIIFASKEGGLYRIIATVYQQRGVGAYSVTIRIFQRK